MTWGCPGPPRRRSSWAATRPQARAPRPASTGSSEYTLAFDGEPHAQQGYHVKLTVHTPYSQGSDTKHKVYWVEGCEEDSELPEAESGAAEDEQGPAEESDAQAEDERDRGAR